MKNEKLIVKNSRGMGLIEILIVLAILGIGFLAIISFLIFSRGISHQTVRSTEATSLAEEGVEAVRRLRDQSWSGNIADKAVATNYYLVISGGSWTLSASNPGVINNLYTRTVRFDNVYRDGSNNISSSGNLDPNTKKLTVRVSWQEGSRNKEVVLTTYITNFLNN
jgi:prepilin-type N-terminal cleavage/methylation domain-containing protein